MDKNALSNYGWIVAVILVLAIMISLATPFASAIKDNVESQVTKFKGTAGDALDNAGNASSFDDLGGGGSGSGSGGGAGSSDSRTGVIPAGAVYTTAAGVTLTGDNGDSFPETVTRGDTYEEGDYIYGYRMTLDDMNNFFLDTSEEYDGGNDFNEWGVRVKDDSKASYGKILSNINGKPITDMRSTFVSCLTLTEAPTIPNSVISMQDTFLECQSLTTAPTIPSSVTDMNGAFNGCISLTTAPTIPSNVTNLTNTFVYCTSLTTAPAIPNGVLYMDSAFSDCAALTSAPTIPSSVTSMNGTFMGCSSLIGTIEINANPSDYYCCLYNTLITEITGSTSLKTEILASKNDEI